MTSQIAWKQVYKGMKASQKADKRDFSRIVEPMVESVLNANKEYAAAQPKQKLEIRAMAINAAKDKLERNHLMANERYNIKLAGVSYAVPAAMISSLITMIGVTGIGDFVATLGIFGSAGAFFAGMAIYSISDLRKIRKAFELFAKDLEIVINNAINPPAGRLGRGASEYQEDGEYRKKDYRQFGIGNEFGGEYSFMHPKPRRFYTDILLIPENSSKEAIKKAYVELARKHYPDADRGNDAEFKRILNAYQHLNIGNN
ncbi:MAG: J domain-containing protein [Candidatus Micrarchaeota archaeon]|nr:J domain-containing protein [Candidatus Micrarchaeota archaeon]